MHVTLLTLTCNVAIAAPVRLTTIEGTSITGEWAGVDSDTAIALLDNDGRRHEVPVDGIANIAFDTATRHDAAPHRFVLVDGSTWNGRLMDAADDGVLIEVQAGGDVVELTLPFRLAAAVQLTKNEDLARAAQLFDQAIANPLPGEDTLVTSHFDEPKAVRGILEKLGPDGGFFSFGGKSRSFSSDKVYGIAMASGAAAPEPGPLRATLCDGSIFCGDLVESHARHVRIQSITGTQFTLPVDSLARIDVTSWRVLYLDELSPAEHSFTGILHESWPWRRRTNVAAGPMRIAGRSFERGIGCHSRTSLTYELTDEFESFAATIGIDDSVRPRGRVVYRVLADGEARFDSGVIGGTDRARDILVDVSGAKRMTLEVDWGPGLDLADHANWGDARLIRPGSRRGNGLRR